MNSPPRNIVAFSVLVGFLLTTGCSGYLNVLQPHNLFMGVGPWTPFDRRAFHTSYANTSYEVLPFIGENTKFAAASCEENYKTFTAITFIRSFRNLRMNNIGSIHELERVDDICRFYAVLTFTFPASHPTLAGQTVDSYYYFYWRERGDYLVVTSVPTLNVQSALKS